MKPILNRPWGRPTRLLAMVLSLGSVLLCSDPPRAIAGTYVMRSCNVPGHPRAPATPWTWVNTANTFANEECGSGGGFGLNVGTMERGSAAAVRIDRPSEGPLSAITIRQARLWMVARLSGPGSWLFVAWVSGGPTGPNGTASPYGPPGGDSLSAPYVTPVFPDDTIGFTVVLTCSVNTADGCSPASANPMEIRGAEITLHEGVQPTGTIETDGLLDGNPQSGVRDLRYSVTDQESGVAQVSIVVGTSTVAHLDFTKECSYSGFAACPQRRTGTMAVNTRDLPNGIYPVTLAVTDAAGNRQSIVAPRGIEVSNDQTARPNGTSAAADVRFTATFAGSRGSAITRSYNAAATVRGRLATRSGVPIGGAAIEIIERAQEAAAVSRTTVMTRADGRFRYAVRARGTSRELTIQYRPNLSNPTVAAAERLRLSVAAAGTLRVRLRGTLVSYRARVISRPVPRRGKVVHVQGRASGGAWTTFAIRRTNRAGVLTGQYRLKVRRPGIRLQFRLRIPKQTGYPYAAGSGRAVARTVS